MLVFGIDVPLVEVFLVLGFVIFILLVEALVIIIMLTSQINKTKKLALLIEKLSETLLEIKKAEIEELDKLKQR